MSDSDKDGNRDRDENIRRALDRVEITSLGENEPPRFQRMSRSKLERIRKFGSAPRMPQMSRPSVSPRSLATLAIVRGRTQFGASNSPRTCEAVNLRGTRCKCPAMMDHPFCWKHDKAEHRRRQKATGARPNRRLDRSAEKTITRLALRGQLDPDLLRDPTFSRLWQEECREFEIRQKWRQRLRRKQGDGDSGEPFERMPPEEARRHRVRRILLWSLARGWYAIRAGHSPDIWMATVARARAEGFI